MEKEERYHEFGSEVDLVISGSPDPRLVRGAPLHETAPRVPAGVILVRVRVGVRKVSEEKKGLGFPRILFVMGERLVGVKALAEVADHAEDVGHVRANHRWRSEPECPRRLPYSHSVIVHGVVLQEREIENVI